MSTTGHKSYYHKLTKIAKGNLLEMTSRVSTAEISSSSPLSNINDKSLLQILQQQNAELEQTNSQIKRFGGEEFNDLMARVLYWNKEKSQQFLKTHPLQLHWDLTSDADLSGVILKPKPI